MFHKKAVLKNFAIFTGNACVGISFLIKMQVFRVPASLKTDSNTGVFYEHWENLRATILNNICERVLLRVWLDFCPIWTNNIASEEDVFSKIKPKQKPFENSAVWKKTCVFMIFFYHFVFLFFSTSRQTAFALHNKKKSFETA